MDSLKRQGIDILDSYSDPLGWKDHLMVSGNFMDVSYEASLSLSCVCRNVKDLDKSYSLILELGKGLVGQGKDRFSVAIDPTSSIFWLLHSDLHEVKVTSVLEYLSSVAASEEPLDQTANGQRKDLENLSLLEQNFGKGKLQSEGFHIDQSGINFTSVSSEDELFNQINQGLLPKIYQREHIDRARVVLPFEYQGNGKPIQIYYSRRSLGEGKTEATLGSSGNSQKAEDSGEEDIIYFRDSDDEMPDSDEDPDDDLDI